MTTASSNPKMEWIRYEVNTSYKELINLIDNPLANLEPKEKLKQSLEEGEWTIMETLAHVLEFMVYWAGEFDKVVKNPGAVFGRNPDNAARNMYITKHKNDSLEEMKKALPEKYKVLQDVLDRLQDSDLQIVGRHVRHSTRTLEWAINEYVIKHLGDHVKQIQNYLEALK